MRQNKRDLLSMLSHDLRNPVSVILGNTDFLDGELPPNTPDGILDYISVVKRNSKQLLELIDELSYSIKMDLQNAPLSFGTVDPKELLVEATIGLDYKFRERDIEFVKDVAEDLPEIQGDGPYIIRALGNLMQNALNYSVSGETVRLKLYWSKEAGGSVCFEVSDSGPGIPENDRARVFEKYYRSPRTSYVRGSGLGLHMVKSVVDMHGGKVELESEEGKGSTFRMFFPIEGAKVQGS